MISDNHSLNQLIHDVIKVKYLIVSYKVNTRLLPAFYELVQRKSGGKIPFYFAQWMLVARFNPPVAQIDPTTFVYKRSVGILNLILFYL